MIDLGLFLQYLKGRCYGNQFCGKITYSLHLSLCHSETEWDIALQISAFIATLIALHHVKNGKNRFSSSPLFPAMIPSLAPACTATAMRSKLGSEFET